VGGTPAYRRQFVRDGIREGMSDFDSWVCRTVLNPRVPLFREARYLLAEAVPAREPGIYHSVLGAIADGNTTNGGIASYVGRSSAEIARPLNVLEDCGFVTRDADIFRRGRSAYRIAEPLISRVLSLGEAKWAKPMGLRHLNRLARARDLLSRHQLDTSATVLACYSGAGFDADLRAAAASRDDVLLVDLDLLYS